MSDTTLQECILCGHETDCIEGICQECQLQIDFIEKDVNEERRERKEL